MARKEKPSETPTETASQRAQERAEELRNDGQHILIVGETQVVYCSPEHFEKYKDTYRCFNRSRK